MMIMFHYDDPLYLEDDMQLHKDALLVQVDDVLVVLDLPAGGGVNDSVAEPTSDRRVPD